MVYPYFSPASKKLVFQFIMEHIDYRKRCLYLQEIISMGKINDVWRRALMTFFDNTNEGPESLKSFSVN